MFAIVLGVLTGGFVSGALWAAADRPRVAHFAVVGASASAVALVAALVGVA